VDGPAFLPLVVRSLVIQVVEDFEMTAYTPRTAAAILVVPSPSLPGAASEYALALE